MSVQRLLRSMASQPESSERASAQVGAQQRQTSGPTGERPHQSRIVLPRLPEETQPEHSGEPEHRNPMTADRRMRVTPGRVQEQQPLAPERNRMERQQNRQQIRMPQHTRQPQQVHNILPPVQHYPMALADSRCESPEVLKADIQKAPDAFQQHEQHSLRSEKALQTIVSEEDWSLGFRPLRISFMENWNFFIWSRALELLQDTKQNGPGARLRQALTAVLRNRAPFEDFSLDFSPVSHHGNERFELVVQKRRRSPGPILYPDCLHFAEHLTHSFDSQNAVTTFECPGSVRIFIAPTDSLSKSEYSSAAHYENLASFLRSEIVPESQKDKLWLELGGQVSRALASQAGPVWVSNERGNGDEQLSTWAALIVSRDCRYVIWMPFRKPGESASELQTSTLAEQSERRLSQSRAIGGG
ncbi:unnamed protein product [Polarella glacialis]|uniref:Uncharacterized protein n=2 Tax=Polarella glacialis TaxID=89957 RepID=A0A813L0Y1_POLGL|nr:unnamed protein product [Polarella glacialis]CAE8714074.1 unnamed protein product [Polarella glacialis]